MISIKSQDTGHLYTNYLNNFQFNGVMESQETMFRYFDQSARSISDSTVIPQVGGAKQLSHYHKYFKGKKCFDCSNIIHINHTRCRSCNHLFFQTKKIEKLKYFVISPEGDQVILGSLLGDGSLSRWANTKYRAGHCNKQVDYMKWKLNVINLPGNGKLYPLNKNTGKSTTTYTYPQLNTYYDLFYQNGKKIVTKKILDKLQPLGLAVWYMDDGSYSDRKLTLSTQSFEYGGNIIIQRYFKEKFNINFCIEKINGVQFGNRFYNKLYYRLILNKIRDIFRFVEMVKPFIHPSLVYKINIRKPTIITRWTPEYKKIWSSVWRTKNKQHIIERNVKYNQLNRERILANKKIYYQKHKDLWRKYKKEYLFRIKNTRNCFNLIFGEIDT